MVEENRRHTGFVVGYTGQKEKGYWTVRVKDQASSYDRLKFVVASSHDDVTLARGLNVDFLIGSLDVSNGNRLLRAVDVKVLN